LPKETGIFNIFTELTSVILIIILCTGAMTFVIRKTKESDVSGSTKT
jgi:hypothetical protein